MKILVIGGTRFIGIHLVNELLSKGHEVTIATRGLTPDVFGDGVSRIQFDRTDRKSVEASLANTLFDVVYDNINYSPTDTENVLDFIKTDRYILTSSAAVYSGGINLREENFNPYQYLIRMGRRDDFSYNEGKRLCESVLFQNYKINAIAVRFPVVIGRDDYTQRLYSYVERTSLGEAMYIDNPDARFSMIESAQAGAFLAFLADRKETGPINASARGDISVMGIINMIEKIVGHKAILNKDGNPGEFNEYFDNVLDTSKAQAMGFQFDLLNKRLRDLLVMYAGDFRK